MDANSFKDKLYFSLIDKLFIGALAAGVVFFFQLQQYKSQMLLHASVAASKFTTDILINQRENLIKEMGAYCLLLEQVKDTGSIKDNQINSIRDYRHRINFITETLEAIDPNIAKVAEPFRQSINQLNNLMTTGSVPIPELEKAISNLLSQYMQILKTIQFACISKTVEEFQTAAKQATEALKTKSPGSL
jgi:hypothetical protein